MVVQEMLNINDNIRHEIKRFYDDAYAITFDRKIVMNMFKTTFLYMHRLDKKSFDMFAQIMIADTYKMLIQDAKNNMLDTDNLLVYLFIYGLVTNDEKSFTSEDVLECIENNSTFFEKLIDATISFEKLNILGKKMVVQNSRDYEDELSKILPTYKIDVLNYGLATTVRDFVDYYNYAMDNLILTSTNIATDIVFHMKHLYLFNRENYIDNLRQMAKGFYKWIKMQVYMDDFDNQELLTYIEILENNDINTIVELTISDNKLLLSIIETYLEYTTSNGIKIRETYILKKELDDYMESRSPVSLVGSAYNKIKK